MNGVFNSRTCLITQIKTSARASKPRALWSVPKIKVQPYWAPQMSVKDALKLTTSGISGRLS